MSKFDSFWIRIKEAQKAAQYEFLYIWQENGIQIPCAVPEIRMAIISGLILAGIRNMRVYSQYIFVLEDEENQYFAFYLS